MWMRLEFEELGMHQRARHDIYKAFVEQALRLEMTESEVWHCAIQQVNSARQLVANQIAVCNHRPVTSVIVSPDDSVSASDEKE